MAGTRDDLEAVIRAQLTRVIAGALQSGVPSNGIMNRATEEILKAVDQAAAGDAEKLAARRRAALPAGGAA